MPEDVQLKFKETYSGSRALKEYYRLNDPRERTNVLIDDSLIIPQILQQ